jgi:hypothetical protein
MQFCWVQDGVLCTKMTWNSTAVVGTTIALDIHVKTL